RIASYRVYPNKDHINYTLFFNDVKNNVMDLLGNMLTSHGVIKVNMEVFGLYLLPSSEVYSEKSFNTPNQITDVSSDLESMFEYIHTYIHTYIIMYSFNFRLGITENYLCE
ncbi:MAG: hypothetical protein KTM48_00635, partial [Wolbachia endosymbiont of Pissodes strobi]|nr:hypothetical protein [Wolbachia endosymbiont of Pissodes strobi]